MKMRLVATTIAVVAVAACGGSGSSDEPATSTTLAPTTTTTTILETTTTSAPTTTSSAIDTPAVAGFVRYDDPVAGFAMLLPEGWVVVSADDVDIDDILSGVAGTSLEAVQQQVAAGFAQGGVLFAFDFDNATPEFVNNINIIRSPAGSVDLAGTAEIARDQFAQIGATDIATEVITLPAGPTLVIRYNFPDINSEGIVYLVRDADTDWVITLSADDTEPLAADLRTMMESFGLTF